MKSRFPRLTLLAALLLAGALLAGCTQPQESGSPGNTTGNVSDDGTMGNRTDAGEPSLPGFGNATQGSTGPYGSI